MIKKIFLTIFIFFVFIINVPNVNAAKLFFSPTTGEYSIDDTFSVDVYMDTEGVSANSTQVWVAYPSDLLEVISTSTSGSVMPPISYFGAPVDTGGVVKYESVIVTPGFNGSNGKVLSIAFKAKKDGTANVYFADSSILANDGVGSNILTNKGIAKFTIKPAPIIPEITPPSDVLPVLPSVPINLLPNVPKIVPSVIPLVVVKPAPVIIAPNETITIQIPTVKSAVKDVKDFLNKQSVQTAEKAVAATGFSFSIISLLMQVSQLRLWSIIISIFGLRKRKPWGVVYDSITKKALDPAYVILKDENGKEISTSITDLDGRYGFTTGKGTYYIEANKTHYIFPSARLKGYAKDELYTDLYFGEAFSISENGQVIAKNIPMDPESFDWNEYQKKRLKLNRFNRLRDLWIYRASSFFLYFGFFMSTIEYIFNPSTFNTVIMLVYLALLILFRTLFKVRTNGVVIRRETKDPVPFTIVRIMSVEFNTEISHKVTDERGRFYALAPNDLYYATVEEKMSDGKYVKIFTSNTFKVTDGVVKEHFEV